jgi:hypothetical protein
MLPNKRAIDQGFGVAHCASVGFKVAFATSVDLFPVNDTPMVSMKQFQKPKVILPPVPAAANTDAIVGKLNDFGPATVEPISGSSWEPLWDRWVSQHHYLGYRPLLGHRLK